MLDIQNVHGILNIVRRIGANRESGQLEITSAGNRGILLFSKGKLVDATLGTLSGFQAVNAAVSLRDVQFSFNPLTAPPRPSAIAASERLVLKSFFGIEAADETESSIDWNTTPHQVVPIEVHDVEQNVTPTLAARLNVETLAEPPRVSAPSPRDRLFSGSKLWSNSYPVEAQSTPQKRRVSLPFAVSLGLLLFLAAAAIVLIPRLQSRRELAAAAPPAAEQASTIPESTTSALNQDSTLESEQKTGEKVTKSQSIDLAQQQSARVRSDASSPAAPKRDGSAQQELDVRNLNGEWRVINTVEKSAFKTYENLQIGFRLTIEQRGNDFTGRGEKVSENGRNLPARNRTPIRVMGSIEGDKVLANFIEDGAARRTNGRFTWRLQNENAALTGRFVSAAANSSGKSAATREP